jgi:hypothetical protein
MTHPTLAEHKLARARQLVTEARCQAVIGESEHLHDRVLQLEEDLGYTMRETAQLRKVRDGAEVVDDA